MKKATRKISAELGFLLALLFFGIFSGLLIYRTTAGFHKYEPDTHLVYLAKRFTEMKLSLSPINRPIGDIVDYYTNIYLYFGPFASLILMPFAAIFGRDFPQIFLGAGSLLVTLLAIYKIAGAFRYEEEDRLWLSVFFAFSTVLFGVSVINFSAYQIQALGASLALLSLAEYFGKRRFWLIGIWVAAAGLTRMTLYLSVIFFLLEWLRLRLDKKALLSLLIPILLSGLVLAGYNYRRFGSVFETGYARNITLNYFPLNDNMKYGFFSIKHIPGNLYVLLFKAPEPILEDGGGFVVKFPLLRADPWGMAIWFTSPLFLMLVRLRRNEFSRSAFFTTLALLIPVILYGGIGDLQFGYRYALDFLPFLFLLLLPNLGSSLSIGAKLLITLGVWFNCLYLSSLWDIYPHFLLEKRGGRFVGGLNWKGLFGRVY